MNDLQIPAQPSPPVGPEEKAEESAYGAERESLLQLEAVLSELKSAIRWHRWQARGWFLLGFLIIGLSATKVLEVANSAYPWIQSQPVPLVYWIFFSTKGAVLLFLALTVAYFCLDRGKVVANEAATLAHRHHAIGFGKLYIEAYGYEMTPEQFRDLFKEWNTTGIPAPATEAKSPSPLVQLLEKLLDKLK